MNPNFTQINVWHASRRLFDAIMDNEGRGPTRVMVMHRLLVEECKRRDITVPEQPTARKDGD